MLENTWCGKLSPQPLKFQDSCLLKDTEPPEARNELEKTVHRSEEQSGRDDSSTETENCLNKVKL